MKQPTTTAKASADPFDQIEETATYTVRGRTFPHVYAAHRHLAADMLREAVQATHARLPLTLTNPTSNPPCSKLELTNFDEASEELRTWLTEHVHTLLPALQLVARANPKSTPMPVDEKE